MGFNVGTSGFEMDRIISSEKHYSPFVCGICKNLVTLDAVVTAKCSHPFCRKCLEDWVSECTSEDKDCTCPECGENLTETTDACNTSTIFLAGVTLSAGLLEELQPLAYKVLELVQVTCPRNCNGTCDWSGDYASCSDHIAVCQAVGENGDTDRFGVNDVSNDDDNSDSEESSDDEILMPKRKTLARNDWNMSINSMAQWADQSMGTLLNSDRKSDTLQVTPTAREEANDGKEDGDNVDEGQQDAKTQQILERTEKLKKQANARFNKGDFSAARDLYTEGIDLMSTFSPDSETEHQLMSHMHSNRGVTFFREKDFDACIDDCEKAIKFDPQYDKSWVRLWRAHVARGEFQMAHETLEKAAETIPESSRIKEELDRSRLDRDLMSKCRGLVEKEKFGEASDLLSGAIQGSTNLALLCLAAGVETQLGNAGEALDLVNKALRLNPQHQESLEQQGRAYFLLGETEQGAHVLYDAYRLDDTKSTTKTALTKYQKTHSALSQARSSMKKGRYEDAVEQLTKAIEECGKIPSQAPIYSILRVERADAYLHNAEYSEALRDCQDVFTVDHRHSSAWIIRSAVLIALGKAGEAKKELSKIKKGWGAEDPLIDEGYKRADFEMRVEVADDDLTKFVKELEQGKSDRLESVTVSNDSMRSNKSRSSDHRSSRASSPRKRANFVEPYLDEKRRSSGGGRRHDDSASVVSRKSKSRKGHEDSSTVATERKPRHRKIDDSMSVGSMRRPRARPSSRPSDEKSVGKVKSSRRSSEEGGSRKHSSDEARKSRSHDDTKSLGPERRPKSRSRPVDDSKSVGGGSRPSRSRPSLDKVKSDRSLGSRFRRSKKKGDS